jgi:hypothetical protein
MKAFILAGSDQEHSYSAIEQACKPFGIECAVVTKTSAASIPSTNSERIIFIAPNLLETVDNMALAIATLLEETEENSALLYQDSQSLTPFPTHIDRFFSYITATSHALPIALIAPTTMFRDCSLTAQFEGNELLALLATHVLSEEQAIATIPIRVDVSRDSTPTSTLLAQILKLGLTQSNIEQIFPKQNWTQYEAESAALCLQDAATQFMRFGDFPSAEECLQHSEQLEESPRTFALKGLIAAKRGQTLEAMAQMVSSLQRYELRKRENQIHLVRYAPQNLEVINSALHAGLDALNSRDNQSALSHFTDAVFGFDPFYREKGLT